MPDHPPDRPKVRRRGERCFFCHRERPVGDLVEIRDGVRGDVVLACPDHPGVQGLHEELTRDLEEG